MALEETIVLLMLVWLLIIWTYAFIKEDGHKKLVAKFVRFVESRKRKNKKRRGI